MSLSSAMRSSPPSPGASVLREIVRRELGRRARSAPAQADAPTDPLAFARRYLPHHVPSDSPEFHRELIRLAGGHDRLALAAPRGHAKSTIMSLIYPLYAAATGRRRFIVVVSDTATQAEDHLGNIYQELLENDDLIRDFPHLALPDLADYAKKRTKRTAKDFITRGGISFVAKGAGAGLRGLRRGNQRPDLIIVDDLENDELVRTPEQRAKLRDWFSKSLSNLFGPDGGQLLVIGTILHTGSLLAWLLSEHGPPMYAKRLYRAIDAAGRILWPDVWTAAKLEDKRLEIGARAFASEFLNDPVDDTLTLFKQDWIDNARRASAPDLARIAVAIDPSISANGDACGIIAAATGHDKRGYVLDDATVQGSPATWARRALDTAARVGASVIVAEGNQGGEMVEQTLRSVLRPGERLPRVVTVHASRSKQARAEPIAALYERGEVSHVGTLPPLEAELVTWVPGLPSPNRLDALVWALTELMLQPEPPARTVTTRRPGSVA